MEAWKESMVQSNPVDDANKPRDWFAHVEEETTGVRVWRADCLGVRFERNDRRTDRLHLCIINQAGQVAQVYKRAASFRIDRWAPGQRKTKEYTAKRRTSERNGSRHSSSNERKRRSAQRKRERENERIVSLAKHSRTLVYILTGSSTER